MPGNRESDDGSPDREEVRRVLLNFAELVQRLEDEGRLFRALPLLLTRLGDVRELLFDYEVRHTERLMPVEDPEEREARRIVREARERMEELADEWDDEGWEPDDDGGSAPA